MGKFLSLILALTMVLSITACSPSGSPDSGNTDVPGTSSTTGDSIYFAMMAPMTGVDSEFGKTGEVAVQMAVEKINAEGGVLGKTLVVDIYDDKDDATEALNVANQILDKQDKYVAIIGNYASTPALSVAPIIQQAGIPYLTPTASHKDLTSNGDYIFRFGTVATNDGKVRASYLLENGYRKTAILYMNDDWGNSLAASFTEDFTVGGGKVLTSEAFIADQTTDFTPMLSKFKGLDIDCLNLFANYKSVASILKQAKSLGIEVPIVTEGASVRSELFDLISDEAEGVLSNSVFPMGTDSQAWHDFEAEYLKRRGAANNLHSYLYYEATLCLASAINEAGTDDHTAVRDALANITWHSDLTDSDLSFNKLGDVIRPQYFGHIEGNELVFDARYQADY